MEWANDKLHRLVAQAQASLGSDGLDRAGDGEGETGAAKAEVETRGASAGASRGDATAWRADGARQEGRRGRAECDGRADSDRHMEGARCGAMDGPGRTGNRTERAGDEGRFDRTADKEGTGHDDMDGPVEQLLHQFQGLIRSVALHYRKTAGFDEAYQEGCLAFLHVIDTYDVRVGPFAAYAARKVRGDVHTAMRRMWRTNDRRQSVTTYEDDAVDDALDRMLTTSLLHHLDYGDIDGWSLAWSRKQDLLAVIAAAGLSDREWLWLRMFASGYGLSDIAKELGVSTETVKTWRKRALRKARMAASELGMM